MHKELEVTDTCEFESCQFHKLIGGPVECCPNYLESVWVRDNGTKYTVKDCSPKRNLLLMHQMFNMIVRSQKAFEELRNANTNMAKTFMSLGVVLNNRSKRLVDANNEIPPEKAS